MGNRINREEDHIRDMLALSEAARNRYKEEQRYQQEEERKREEEARKIEEKNKYIASKEKNGYNYNNQLHGILNAFIDPSKLDYSNMQYQDMRGVQVHYAPSDEYQCIPFVWDDAKENETVNINRRKLSYTQIAEAMFRYKFSMYCKIHDVDSFKKKQDVNPYAIKTNEIVWKALFFTPFLKATRRISVIYNIRKIKIVCSDGSIKEEPVIRIITYFKVFEDDVIEICGKYALDKIHESHDYIFKKEVNEMKIHQKTTKNIKRFIQENNLSIEQFFKEYHPNIIAIIEQENIWTIDRLYDVIDEYLDENMLFLHKDNPLYPKARYEVNEDNLEKYNLINVVAYNASMDKMRQYWKGMPECANGDFNRRWPECGDLRYMIMCGVDQNTIHQQFPKAFKEHTVLPRDVEGREILIQKYSTNIQPHRKFYFADKNGNRLTDEQFYEMEANFLKERGWYDMDYVTSLDDGKPYNNGNYKHFMDYIVVPEDVPQTSDDDTEILK